MCILLVASLLFIPSIVMRSLYFYDALLPMCVLSRCFPLSIVWALMHSFSPPLFPLACPPPFLDHLLLHHIIIGKIPRGNNPSISNLVVHSLHILLFKFNFFHITNNKNAFLYIIWHLFPNFNSRVQNFDFSFPSWIYNKGLYKYVASNLQHYQHGSVANYNMIYSHSSTTRFVSIHLQHDMQPIIYNMTCSQL